ncbi:MAG TPA: hypothetical protein VFL94_08355 [Actinomycetales bacterium]|nr:hypothetical protein [Actinomycetales bacterium]
MVPGVPSRVRELAEQLEDVARGLGVMRRAFTFVPGGDWSGPASLAFTSLLDQQPAAYAAAARSMSSAASAVRSHAAVLEVAQQDAEEAVRLDVAGAQATLRWLGSASASQPRVVGSPSDPGLATRRQALEQVALATRRARASAASTTSTLRDAAHHAPDRPRWPARLARSVGALSRDVELGAAETVTGAASLALRLDPSRLLRDPDGYSRDAAATGHGLALVATHPGELVTAVADVETWHENRGRWLGHLLPDVVLAVATAGAAPVAERTASTAARVAARIGPKALREPLAEAISLQAGTGRSALRLRDVRPHRTTADAAGYRTPVAPLTHAVGRRVARDARWAEPLLTPRVQRAVAELQRRPGSADAVVQLGGLDHAVKGRDSLLRKLTSEPAGGGPAAHLARELNDTVRYTLTVPGEGYVTGAVDAVSAMEGQGLTLTAAKSFWGSDRYQGLNLTFHDPLTGRPFELQVHTPESWEATVDTHVDYEWFRCTGIPPELRRVFGGRIAARFATVPRPDDVELLTELLRPRPEPARTTTPEIASLLDVGRGLRLSTSVHGTRSLACDDDE